MKISKRKHVDPSWGYLELEGGSIVAMPKKAMKELQAENEKLKKEVADYHQLQWQHDALIDENEKLKYALKQRTAQSDANANLWMKELRTGAKQEKEIEQYRKENVRLKCLALHLFENYFVAMSAFFLNFGKRKRAKRLEDLSEKYGEAYRKAKKELR